jgi:hypothetical protein
MKYIQLSQTAPVKRFVSFPILEVFEHPRSGLKLAVHKRMTTGGKPAHARQWVVSETSSGLKITRGTNAWKEPSFAKADALSILDRHERSYLWKLVGESYRL